MGSLLRRGLTIGRLRSGHLLHPHAWTRRHEMPLLVVEAVPVHEGEACFEPFADDDPWGRVGDGQPGPASRDEHEEEHA